MPTDGPMLRALSVHRCTTCGHSLAEPCAHCGADGDHVATATEAEAARVLRALALAACGDPTAYIPSAVAPDPVPPAYIRAMADRVGGQRAAARLLHVDERTLRRWVAGDRSCPWAVAELLRRMALGPML